MADEKEKTIQADQEATNPAGDKQAELSEKDLEKASGGAFDAYIQINDIKTES
jgi:hypothetical protein